MIPHITNYILASADQVAIDAIAARIQDESLFSVDIVEYLIKKGVSYRRAHDIVGRMVRDCLDKGRKISSLSDKELRKYSPELKADVRNILKCPGVSEPEEIFWQHES